MKKAIEEKGTIRKKSGAFSSIAGQAFLGRQASPLPEGEVKGDKNPLVKASDKTSIVKTESRTPILRNDDLTHEDRQFLDVRGPEDLDRCMGRVLSALGNNTITPDQGRKLVTHLNALRAKMAKR